MSFPVLASTGWDKTDVYYCDRPLPCLNTIHLSCLNSRHLSCLDSKHWGDLGGTKTISTPFLHLKCAKWSTPGGEGGEAGAPEMEPHAAARSFSTPWKPSPRLYLDLLLLQVILEALWINWKVTKTISIPFFDLKCAKWSTPAEKPEKMEPRKCNHMALRAARFYTRRGLGLREFSKQTPSNYYFVF